MATTLEEVQAELAAYKAAALAIVTGAQSYGIAGRTLTKANLTEINNRIRELEARVDRITRKEAGQAMNTCVPVFISNR